MNAERLHAIALAIANDLKTTRVETNLQQLVTALQNQINQPNQPQHQQQVSQFLKNLEETLGRAPSNEFSPTWEQAVEAIGARNLLGRKLWERIRDVFSRNQITPSTAHAELEQILKDLQSIAAALGQLISAFGRLGIGAEDLNPGECEVGILVPRGFVDNQLDKFAVELSELDTIFKPFVELSTGSRPEFSIRAISSSDFSVFLDSIPAAGACIAVGVERIVALNKSLLEIRKLQNDLANQGIEKKNLKGIEDHADSLMEKGIDEVIKKLVKEFYKKSDDGRKNELTTELRFSLNKIANRIDRGFNLEVRMAPRGNSKPEGEGRTGAEDDKFFVTIEEARRNLQFLKLEGNPILSLTEGEGEKGKKK